VSAPDPSGMSPGISPSDAVRIRIMAAVRAEPVAPRAVGMRHRAWLLAVALAFSVVVSFAIGRPGLRGRPLAYVAGLAVAWALVAAAATWAGVVRGRSMLGPSLVWRTAVAVLTPIALYTISLGLGAAWPQTLIDHSSMGSHVLCLVGTTAFALGPLAAFAAMRRASDPVAPRLTGAAIGAAAGAWGALGIELHCRHASPFHVAVAHVLPVIAVALAGLFVISPFVAIRAERR
jgi:hypothetical protein